jgi:chitin disaccharide deacetylase
MGTLYQNEALFRALLRAAHDNRLPVMVSREWFGTAPFLRSALGADDIVLDRIIIINPTVPPEHWAGFDANAIKSISPGVTEMIVHLAFDDEEMRAMTVNHPDWGAGWRQRDFDFVTSASFRTLLKENNIKLITWREISKRLGKSQK